MQNTLKSKAAKKVQEAMKKMNGKPEVKKAPVFNGKNNKPTIVDGKAVAKAQAQAKAEAERTAKVLADAKDKFKKIAGKTATPPVRKLAAVEESEAPKVSARERAGMDLIDAQLGRAYDPLVKVSAMMGVYDEDWAGEKMSFKQSAETKQKFIDLLTQAVEAFDELQIMKRKVS
jgi:hypothetical protein